MNKKKLVILTGAGISAESGLKTFRDSDGLWEGYDVYEVATPRGFKANPQLVLDFYNMRRKDVAAAAPNAAHFGLAALEKDFDVTIITQNIDDLHATEDKRVLLNRVKRIIEKNERSFNYRHQLVSLLMITILVSCIAWLSPAKTNLANGHQKPQQVLLAEPLSSKMWKPLFNPVALLIENEQILEGKTPPTVHSKQLLIGDQKTIVEFAAKPLETCSTNLLQPEKPSLVSAPKNINHQIQTKGFFDTSFKHEMGRFLVAPFWNELENTALELKQVQFAMADLKQNEALDPEEAIALDEMEAGFKKLRRTKTALANASSKIKSAQQIEELKDKVRAFALQSIKLKKVADEWNTQLRNANKELIEASVALKNANINLAKFSVNPKITQPVLYNVAVSNVDDSNDNNDENATQKSAINTQIELKLKSVEDSKTTIIITTKGKVLKVIKI